MRATEPAAHESAAVGRFAPSPSGRMHLGNLFCCLLAWLSARQAGGKIILRQEDLDPQRTSRAYGEQLMRDLLFLGLDWDQGPYWQSERGAYYQACLDKLESQGLVYPCFCSRGDLHAANAPHTADGDVIYSGKCRGLSSREVGERQKRRPPALRLRAKGRWGFTDRHYGPFWQDLPADCGDFILRRSDGVFAYQLAVVADDGAMGVTQVVRGRDLLSSTPRQLYLYRLLGLAPPAYAHVPLLLAKDGRRLSKRERDLGLDALRARFTAEEIIGKLAFLAGLIPRPEAVKANELIGIFSWDKTPIDDVLLPEGLFEK